MSDVVAVPAPGLSTTEVRGSDRVSWLNGLVTVDLREVGPGRAAYGLAVSKVGRVLADLFVVGAGDALLFGSPTAATAGLRGSFEKYLVMEDADLAPRDDLRWITLHGDAAPALAASIAEAVSGFAGAVDGAAVGAHGAVLVLPAARESEALERLRSEGATVLTEAAFEAQRIAAGVPRYGVDFDDKTYPQEASLEKRAVSFSRAATSAKRWCAASRCAATCTASSSPSRSMARGVAPGTAIKVGDDVVGTVTSAASGVAFAMIKYAQSEPGTTLEVGSVRGVVRAPRDR